MLAHVTLRADDVTRIKAGHAVTEASQIGLAPGDWPDLLAVTNRQGDGYLLQRDTRLPCGGYNYVSRCGRLTLGVFND